MAINNLNFRGRNSLSGGRFSPAHVRRIIGSQFKDLNLPMEAQNHFARELGSGKTITGSEFDKAVNEAHEKGYISSGTAEKMKDAAKIPDKFNEHWK